MVCHILRLIVVLHLAIAIWVIEQAFISPSSVYAQDDFSCADVSEIPQDECEALIALFFAYPSFYLPADWLMTATPCSWADVICDGGHIVELSITNNTSDNSPPWSYEDGPRPDWQTHHNVAIPSEIGNLTALTALSFEASFHYESFNFIRSSTRIVSLPPEIGNLSSLSILDLRRNNLVTLPPQIGDLTTLTSLNLSDNSLESLPPGFGNLSALTTLNLNFNELDTLPPEFGNLSSLETLDLTSNGLTSLPPEFGNLSALSKLSLDSYIPPRDGSSAPSFSPTRNNLVSLPEEFGDLSALRELDITHSKLIRLPATFGNLSSLEILDFIDNPDVDLRTNAYSHPLTSLPDGFGNLSSLRVLDLRYGELTELPQGFGDLSSLETLLLDGNKISELPAEIGNLVALRTFSMGPDLELVNSPLYREPVCHARLTSLPAEIGNLTSLEELDLSCSLIQNLPEEFNSFPDSIKQLIEGAGVLIANFASRLPFIVQ